MKADVAAFLDDPHQVFAWHSSGLVTHNFENLVLVVDGQVVDPNAPTNRAPVAADDGGDVRQFANPSTAGNVIAGGLGVDIDPDGDSLSVVGLIAGNQRASSPAMSVRRWRAHSASSPCRLTAAGPMP